MKRITVDYTDDRMLVAMRPRPSKRKMAADKAWSDADLQRIKRIRERCAYVDPSIDVLPFLPHWFREIVEDLKGAPLAVLTISIARANNKTGIAYPGVELLCIETGYGHCKVEQARAFLVSCGLLVSLGQKRVKGGLHGRAEFRLGWWPGRRGNGEKAT